MEESLYSFVGVNVGASTEGNILHKSQSIQWEKFQRRWNRIILVIVGLGSLWNRIPGNRTNIPTLGRFDKIDTGSLHLHASIVERRLERNINGLLGQQVARGKDIDTIHELRRPCGGWEGLRHDSNTATSLAVSVEQSRLYGHVIARQIFSIVGQIKTKDRIRVDVWKRHQIRSSNEKVAVIVRNSHSLGNTSSHHRLKGSSGSQCLVQLFLESWTIFFKIEHDIRIKRSGRIFGKISQRCQVDVGIWEDEHVDTDLLPTEFNRRILVPFAIRAQEFHFGTRSHQRRIFSWFQGSITHIGLNRLEDQHFSTDLFHYSEGCLQGRTQTRLPGHRVLDKHFWKTV